MTELTDLFVLCLCSLHTSVSKTGSLAQLITYSNYRNLQNQVMVPNSKINKGKGGLKTVRHW